MVPQVIQLIKINYFYISVSYLKFKSVLKTVVFIILNVLSSTNKTIKILEKFIKLVHK